MCFRQNWAIFQEWIRKGDIQEGMEVGPTQLTNFQRNLDTKEAINITWVG